ncbi:MAG: mannose-6-phosphate isomerase, class I [Desulfobacteraceae bacterium]|nr:mannose-6-phosphate isomerase, class I [Desulfobacteraceae bacterium]
MEHIFKLKNPIQPYAWGSRTALAEFLGQTPSDNSPQAELWMGAHPKAASEIYFQQKWQKLDAVISNYPTEMLGRQINTDYSSQLPYLFKVLAADQPLSIQAHPSMAQAQKGYEYEKSQGIYLTAANRNYKDNRHKPECIVALTPFWGICGFRPVSQMLSLLKTVWPDGMKKNISNLEDSPDSRGVRRFFNFLMQLSPDQRLDLIPRVLKNTEKIKNQDRAFEWMRVLNNYYPNDIGVLSPLLLNLVCLQPGEGLFLAAGQLHAYLSGLGIEIMANSDNVLRGGLTPKHVDVPELMKILDFNPGSLSILKPEPVSDTESCYESLADEFELSCIHISSSKKHISAQAQLRSPEILLCSNGNAVIRRIADPDECVNLEKAESAFVAFDAGQYAIEGSASLFKAAVNRNKYPRPAK